MTHEDAIPATLSDAQPESGAQTAHAAQGPLVERLAEAIEDGLFRMHGLTSSCDHHEEARTLLPLVEAHAAAQVEAAVSVVRAETEQARRLESEMRRRLRAWRTRAQAAESEVRALREKVAKVEALPDRWEARVPSDGHAEDEAYGDALSECLTELRAALSDPTTPDQKGGE